MINRVAFSIFGLDIYWYGISYVLGFIFSYFFILRFSPKFNIKKDLIEDIFFYSMIGGVLMGRVFHILFYDLSFYILNPQEILRFDHGGMSIHGGFVGVFLVLFYFSKKYKLNLLNLTDLFVIPSGLALAFGRLANFINQELVGKVTNSNFGVVFELYDEQKRWPTTIFESAKNMIVFQISLFQFFILNIQKKPGVITAWFLIIYNIGRFIIDFLREPDVLIGFISMGQFMCILFAGIGFYLLYKKNKNN